jgi:chromosome partitioning protein
VLAVLVTNIKGGCGKTTIATSLATAFAADGHPTALADVDRQRSAWSWLASRPAAAPTIGGLDWRKSCEPVPSRMRRLVIDAPAAMTLTRLEELLPHANFVLVPVLPSALDMQSTRRFLTRLAELKPIRKHRARVGLVVNRQRSRTRSMHALDTFLATVDHPVLARLSDRALYADLAGRGLGLFDPGTGQWPAVRAEWQPLLNALEASG